MLIKFRHEPRWRHCSSVAVQLLLNDVMTYSIAVCAAIGTDWAKNTIPLLFLGRCLVMAGCCDSTVLALSEYATISCCLVGGYHHFRRTCCLLQHRSPVNLFSLDDRGSTPECEESPIRLHGVNSEDHTAYVNALLSDGTWFIFLRGSFVMEFKTMLWHGFILFLWPLVELQRNKEKCPIII
jgi:hypothetical protein